MEKNESPNASERFRHSHVLLAVGCIESDSSFKAHIGTSIELKEGENWVQLEGDTFSIQQGDFYTGFVCVDVDGQFATVKDMRFPHTEGPSYLEVQLTHRHGIRSLQEEHSPAGGYDSDDEHEDTANEKPSGDRYTEAEALPRRQMRMLHQRDRIVLRNPERKDLPLVLEYRHHRAVQRANAQENAMVTPEDAVREDEAAKVDEQSVHTATSVRTSQAVVVPPRGVKFEQKQPPKSNGDMSVASEDRSYLTGEVWLGDQGYVSGITGDEGAMSQYASRKASENKNGKDVPLKENEPSSNDQAIDVDKPSKIAAEEDEAPDASAKEREVDAVGPKQLNETLLPHAPVQDVPDDPYAKVNSAITSSAYDGGDELPKSQALLPSGSGETTSDSPKVTRFEEVTSSKVELQERTPTAKEEILEQPGEGSEAVVDVKESEAVVHAEESEKVTDMIMDESMPPESADRPSDEQDKMEVDQDDGPVAMEEDPEDETTDEGFDATQAFPPPMNLSTQPTQGDNTMSDDETTMDGWRPEMDPFEQPTQPLFPEHITVDDKEKSQNIELVNGHHTPEHEPELDKSSPSQNEAACRKSTEKEPPQEDHDKKEKEETSSDKVSAPDVKEPAEVKGSPEAATPVESQRLFTQEIKETHVESSPESMAVNEAENMSRNTELVNGDFTQEHEPDLDKAPSSQTEAACRKSPEKETAEETVEKQEHDETAGVIVATPDAKRTTEEEESPDAPTPVESQRLMTQEIKETHVESSPERMPVIEEAVHSEDRGEISNTEEYVVSTAEERDAATALTDLISEQSAQPVSDKTEGAEKELANEEITTSNQPPTSNPAEVSNVEEDAAPTAQKNEEKDTNPPASDSMAEQLSPSDEAGSPTEVAKEETAHPSSSQGSKVAEGKKAADLMVEATMQADISSTPPKEEIDEPNRPASNQGINSGKGKEATVLEDQMQVDVFSFPESTPENAEDGHDFGKDKGDRQPEVTPSRRKRARPSSARKASSKRAKVETQDLENTDRPRVMLTGVKTTSLHKNMIDRIGAVLVEDIENAAMATHVIATDKDTPLRRTPKLMIGLCRTSNVVSMAWLTKSARARRVLDCSDFLVHDKAAEEKYDFSLRKALKNGEKIRRHSKFILTGWYVYVCKGVAGNKAPPENELRLIVEAAGGKWLSAVSNSQINDIDCDRILLIGSDPTPKKQVKSRDIATAIKKGAHVVTTSWFFHSMISQSMGEF